MRILTIVDKTGSAIWRMARDTQSQLPFVFNEILSLHPKRPDKSEIENIKKYLEDGMPDLVDVQYWRSGKRLLEMFPELIKVKKTLTHHNPYDLVQEDWKEYQKIIVCNQTQKRILQNAELIEHGIDVTKFKWNREYTKSKTVLMVAGRIEGKKGILPVAKVCHELGYKFILAGKISDPDYFGEILKYKPTLALDICDEELIELYRQSALHVCNSVDNFESGTLPILEAIASGVPVLTRKIGYVPELNNDGVFLRDGQPEDEVELKEIISMLMENFELRNKMRDEAWGIMKEKNSFRRSIILYKLWRKLIYDNSEFVSVIIPTYNRPDQLKETLKGYKDQTYKNFEIIVADDNSSIEHFIEDICDDFSFKTGIVVKYLNTHFEGYGLAKARNMGICEADGNVIIFNDDRWKPRPDLIQNFLRHIQEKHYLCANRQNNKKSFCEGISCIYKKDIINAGMFNEEINEYGGMSQEIRTRMARQNVKCNFCEDANVDMIFNSKSRQKRKDEILRMKNKLWRLGI